MPRSSDGWLATVRSVLADIAASDVTEFELSQQEFRLRLRRKPTRRLGTAAVGLEVDEGAVPVHAPFTGVFYRSPSPTAEPFVRDGDWVEAGTTIGLVETMKIFNAVRVESSGRVIRVLAQSGQLVQAGEPLILLRPEPR